MRVIGVGEADQVLVRATSDELATLAGLEGGHTWTPGDVIDTSVIATRLMRVRQRLTQIGNAATRFAAISDDLEELATLLS